MFGLIFFLLFSSLTESEIDSETQLIVVLTGDSHRIGLGFDLLNNSTAQALLVSGVGNGVRLTDLVGHDNLRQSPKPLVILGRTAENTEGNAIEAKITMQMLGYRRVCIVTSDYHILRSYLLFRRHNPDAQISVAAAPSRVTIPFNRKNWLLVREYHATLAFLFNWGYDAAFSWYNEQISSLLQRFQNEKVISV
ncbi:MAG: YdcF family protein [Proteobacteria bacterium]|nr:YdcF family protein [Pseudomonadota bacterium]